MNYMEKIKNLIETFKQNKALIIIGALSAFIVYHLIIWFFINRLELIPYTTKQTFEFISLIPFFLLGYFTYKYAREKKVKTLVLSIVLTSLTIIPFNFIDIIEYQDYKSILEIILLIIIITIFTTIDILVPAFLGGLLAKQSEQEEDTKKSFIKNCFIKTIWATGIVTTICIISYELSTLNQLDYSNIIGFFLILPIANPMLIFFFIYDTNNFILLIPVTFLYYGLFITIQNAALLKRKNSQRKITKILYLIPIILLYLIHLSMAFIGIAIIAFAGY